MTALERIEEIRKIHKDNCESSKTVDFLLQAFDTMREIAYEGKESYLTLEEMAEVIKTEFNERMKGK
jgi:hypothetical protein